MVTNKRVEVPIYDFTIYVTIFDEWEEVRKYHKDKLNEEREGFTLINDADPTKLKLFINIDCPSCIMHEIIHIKNIIFEVINHISDTHNDEPEAYLVQYLYKKIVEIYYKHKDNAKK